MRCNKARQFISLAMDEQLPPTKTHELGEHLDHCSGCQDFRKELIMGRRLLTATEPVLSDNFDWRLQLKLNQTLQQTAGETAYPWHEEDRKSPRGWLGNFTTSVAVGLAAVLTLAMFMDPGVNLPVGAGASNSLNPASTVAGVTDRLPLTRQSLLRPFGSNEGVRRSVSRSGVFAQPGNSFSVESSWSGNHLQDLMKIQELRLHNRRLNNQIYQYQKQISLLREQLDSPDSNTLNLEQE